jgi:hypothetical protein
MALNDEATDSSSIRFDSSHCSRQIGSVDRHGLASALKSRAHSVTRRRIQPPTLAGFRTPAVSTRVMGVSPKLQLSSTASRVTPGCGPVTATSSRTSALIRDDCTRHGRAGESAYKLRRVIPFNHSTQLQNKSKTLPTFGLPTMASEIGRGAEVAPSPGPAATAGSVLPACTGLICIRICITRGKAHTRNSSEHH